MYTRGQFQAFVPKLVAGPSPQYQLWYFSDLWIYRGLLRYTFFNGSGVPSTLKNLKSGLFGCIILSS